MKIKKVVDPVAFQTVIDKLEKNKPFKNLTVLFKAVAKSDWGKTNKITAPVAYARFREFGLTAKTKPGRTFQPKEGNAPPANFFQPFTSRGIEVSSLDDIITSAYKTAEQNEAIRDAWREVRKTAGPRPEKGGD
jgi:hypothetical protein